MRKWPGMKTVAVLPPGNNNPRNSEGDFLDLGGSIIFAYSRFTGRDWHDNSSCDIAALFSYDNGESFTEQPVILVKAAEHAAGNVMSVSLCFLPDGSAGLFYLIKYRDRWDYVLRRSRDNCKTFGPAVTCIGDGPQGFCVVNNCRVIESSTKRLLIPAAFPDTERGRGYLTRFYYSDDGGNVWRRSPAELRCTAARSISGYQEPGLLQTADSTLHCYIRTDLFAQYESYSFDDGLTWTAAEPSRFSSPLSPMLMTQNIFTGEYFAVWNPIPSYNGRKTTKHGWGRTPLVMAHSADGENFSAPFLIGADPQRGYCYPAMKFLDASTALLAVCSGGREDRSCLNRTEIFKLHIEQASDQRGQA